MRMNLLSLRGGFCRRGNPSIGLLRFARNDVALIIVLTLTACASPTFEMSPAQVASLSDDQLCKYKNNYRDETKLELEISKRNLNCDRFYRACLAQGNQPGTKAMDFCQDVLRENERLRYDNDRPWRHESGIGIYNTIPLRHR